MAGGFTIIELTMVLALISVVMGLVIVRLDFGSPRQRVIEQARKLGNVIRSYRERAICEDQSYCMTVDLKESRWAIERIKERQDPMKGLNRPLSTSACESPVRIRGITLSHSKNMDSPVVIYLDPRGVLPDLQIDIGLENGPIVSVQPDPLVNEVAYVER